MMSMLNLLWIVPIVAGMAWGFGYKANPERVKAFVKAHLERVKAVMKAHLVDDDPYQDEGHSATRYAQESGEYPIAREARKAAEVVTQGDYIDWSKVPEGFDWVAQDGWDSGGPIVRAYKEKPILAGDNWTTRDFLWSTVSNNENHQSLIGPLPPWRESLRKRPS